MKRALLAAAAGTALLSGCSSGPKKMPSSELYLTERMATVFLQQGNANEAENAFRQVLVDDPDNPEMRDGHGLALLMLGRPKEARDEFDRALKIAPKESYLNNRGVAKMELGDYAGAEADFLQAYKSPSLADRQSALINLGRARMRRGIPAEAEDAFTRALALVPDSYEALMARGEAREALKNEKGAVEDYLAALKLRAENLDAMLHVGMGLLALDNRDLGIRYLRRVTELAPDSPQAARARLILGEGSSATLPE
ncbi:MAG TPA: tetratricopeptide repeat protein [Thermoanaerobaculia bacterium]|nr:tetratricopeptide repeat protein [Thermoanaerobaculia bacterium]